MNSRFKQINILFYTVVILLSSSVFSCGPSISSFNITPLTATENDTLKVSWDISGTPTLLVYSLNDSSDNNVNQDINSKLIEFKLVVEKGGKKVVQPIQVTLVPETSNTQITFPTDLHGDTLVAEGKKNPERWNEHFRVVEVSSLSGRDLMVGHSDRNANLDSEGTPSKVFEGTPVQGYWSIKSLLTEQEKISNTDLPVSLKLKITIKYER